MSTRIPLAWLNLTHDPRRFVLSLAGVGFAVVLMFMESGFFFALLDATVALIERFDADLVMVSSTKSSLQAAGTFPHRRLVQVLADPAVLSTHPLYLEEVRSVWRSDRTKHRQQLRVLGVDPDDPGLRLPEVLSKSEHLRRPDGALFDRASRETFGEPNEATERDELARKKVSIGGTFQLGLDFVHEGNVIVGASAIPHFFPRPGNSPLSLVEIGLIRLVPGSDPRAVAERLNRALQLGVPSQQQFDGHVIETKGRDVKVMTVGDFRNQERTYWRTSTPVGFIFGLGLGMGLIVGVVICYQVLGTDVADHLPEFATLKAMGYSDAYLTGVVLQQALWLAILAFIPGCALSAALFYGLAELTGLPLKMTLWRAAGVLLLTILMCGISGLLTVRKLREADPADLF